MLGDPEKRGKYDELGANWRQYEQAQKAGTDGDWAANFGGPGFGGATSYRTMTPEEMEEMFGGQDSFSDFFHAFFGGEGPTRTSGRAGRGSRSRTASRSGQDLEQLIDLTLEEAFAGTSRRIVVREGKSDRTVEVRIPAGVKDGARVRAANEGGPGAHGGKRGDLYLIVRLLAHPRFERRAVGMRARPVTTASSAAASDTPADHARLKTRARETAAFRLRDTRPRGRPMKRRSYDTIEVQLPQDYGRTACMHIEGAGEIITQQTPKAQEARVAAGQVGRARVILRCCPNTCYSRSSSRTAACRRCSPR